MSMLGLGVVLFITLQGHSYALAGAVSASGALINSFCGPFLSRRIDRLGQHRVLPIAAAISISFQVVFIVLVLHNAPIWTWFLTWCLGDAFIPNVGSLIRARWAAVLSDVASVRSAFAFESVIDELVFITGPPVATFLAIGVTDYASVVASMILLATGTMFLVPQRATEPPLSGPEHHEGRAAILTPGIPLVSAVLLLVGVLFGAFEVGTVAFADEAGQPGATGILIAVYSIGSAVAGLTLGSLHLRLPLPRQFLLAMVFLSLSSLPIPFIHQVWVLGVVGMVMGLGVSPVLITGFGLAEELVPSERLTEGLTVVGAGIGIGFAVGSSLAGYVIDRSGASAAFVVLAIAGLLGAALALLGTRNLNRAYKLAHVDPVAN